MCESSHCNDEQWFVFSCSFLEIFWRLYANIPLRIDRATMLKWNSRHMTSFAEGFLDHLLRSDYSTNHFHWIWLGFEGPYGGLLVCCRLIRIDPLVVTYDDLINVFWSTAIVFFPTFLCTNRHEPFLERLSNYAGSNENKSFLLPDVHAILKECWWKKCPRMHLSHISRYVTCTSFLSERRPQLNSLNQFFTVLQDGALSPKKYYNSSMHCKQYK